MVTPSILVVEDDPTLVHAITRNLIARSYRACSATTVAGATLALEEETPALVLLDIDLPDGSGWEVLRALRSSGHADVPAVVMSALRPNPRLCAEMETAGVLEKPFPMEALLHLVTTLLGRSAEQVAPVTSEGAGEG